MAPCLKKLLSVTLVLAYCSAGYAQLDTNGLIAHWPFNGNLNDSTGKGHNAGAVNSTTWQQTAATYINGVNGKGNAACEFNGSYLIGTNFKPYLNKFTICAVLKPIANIYSDILVRSSIGLQNEPGFGAWMSSAGSGTNICFSPVSYYYGMYTSAEMRPFQYSPSTVSNKWYYVIITYDNDTFKTYVNGALKTVQLKHNTIFDSTACGAITIGWHMNSWLIQPSGFYFGLMDDLRLYNRAMSDTEIVKYRFNFYDTAVVMNMARADSVLCAGDSTLTVPYIVSRNFRPGNVFTVQLSDSTGSFATPVNIGRDSTNKAGTIQAIVPGTVTPGRYLLRIIASSPADTTPETGINIHPSPNLHSAVVAHIYKSFYWQPIPGKICAGDSVRFTVDSTRDMGLYYTPSYQWQKNNVNITGANSYQYYTANILNNDVFRCVVTSGHQCWSGAKDTTAGYTVTVDTLVQPIVTIKTLHSDTICLGDSVRLHVSSKTHAGPSGAQLRWYRNSQIIQYNGDSLSTYLTHITDSFYCVMTSSAQCATGTATSNKVGVAVDSNKTIPKVSIVANKSLAVLMNDSISFTAKPLDTGTVTYQWLLNGNPVPGAASHYFTVDTSNASSGDIISLRMTSSKRCRPGDTILSNSLQVNFYWVNIPSLNHTPTFTLHPNPNGGAFTLSGSTNDNSPAEVTVINLVGQKIYTRIITPRQNSINANIHTGDNIPNGIYLLRITQSGKIHTLRFTVNK